MYHSSNSIVRTVFNNALYNSNSCIGYKMAYFRNVYAIDINNNNNTLFQTIVHMDNKKNKIKYNVE